MNWLPAVANIDVAVPVWVPASVPNKSVAPLSITTPFTLYAEKSKVSAPSVAVVLCTKPPCCWVVEVAVWIGVVSLS